MSSESREAGDDFAVALFNLLSCLNNVPEALTHVLQEYLERAQLWGHLYTLAGEVTNSCFIMLEFRGHSSRLTKHGTAELDSITPDCGDIVVGVGSVMVDTRFQNYFVVTCHAVKRTRKVVCFYDEFVKPFFCV